MKLKIYVILAVIFIITTAIRGQEDTLAIPVPPAPPAMEIPATTPTDTQRAEAMAATLEVNGQKPAEEVISTATIPAEEKAPEIVQENPSSGGGVNIGLSAQVRQKLKLKAGDGIIFQIIDNNIIVMKKSMPFDKEYLKAIAKTLSEWNSAEDGAAYEHLQDI